MSGARGFSIRLACGGAVERVAAASAHAFARHTHSRYGIGLLVAGAQRSASGRGPVEAVRGDLITVNPGEVHDGAPVGEGGRAWNMLYFDPSWLRGLLAEAAPRAAADRAEFAHPVLRSGPGAAAFARLFAGLDLRSEARAEGAPDLALEAWLLDVLAPLVADAGTAPETGPGVPAALRHARARLDAAPPEPVSLAELAAEAGLGRYAFLRAFRRSTGLPPHAYLLQRRLERARALIAGGEPLAQAAAAAGFADQPHLTRLFVRAYGYTPGAYRAAVRGLQ